MERVIRFPSGACPDWPAVADRLRAAGEEPAVKMIDGLPALPDDEILDDWKDLRVGLTGGMVTVRRTAADRVSCVTWGNADPALMRAWNLCSWATAAAGGGILHTPDGAEADADQFKAALNL